MVIIDELKALNGPQRAAFFASFLGWALDAFDFFLLTFILKDIAARVPRRDPGGERGASSLTLAARPLGAFVFGRLADRYGRRPILMIDVGLYSVLAIASAFSPNLIVLLVLRSLFGFAMGGEWGIGASLALETIPAKSRGVISGILQEGYPMGYFLAAMANLVLPHHRLARHAGAGRAAGAADPLHPTPCAGDPRLAGRTRRGEDARNTELHPGDERALEPVDLRRGADDLLQLLQPWHARISIRPS